jgi:serine/alanine adding enzyme
LSTTDRAEGPPDVYFLPDYVRAASIAEHGESLYVDAHNGAWRMPLIIRRLDHGLVDAITPTFSGIYASPGLSPDQIQEAWQHSVDRLRERGVVSLVVRGSPVVPQATSVPGLRSISSGRPTVVLDLTDDAAAWDGMKSSCRSRIRKAEKNGYTGELRPAALPDVMPGGDFRDLYEATMDRIGADPLYHFGDDYYAELLAGLGANLLLAEVRDRSGVVVSSCLLMRHGPRLHYHLAGSRPEDARLGSNNLMMWSGIRFAIADGLGHFHVGAGVAGRDGVYRFKTTFGGREAAYDVSGLAINDKGYEDQVLARAKECGVTADELEASGFFPAYRAGTPVASA